MKKQCCNANRTHVFHMLLILTVFFLCTYSNKYIGASSFDEEEYVNNEVIVILNSECTTNQFKQILRQISSSATIVETDDSFVLLRLPSYESMDQTITALSQFPEIMTAEPNYTFSGSALTDDTFANAQWALRNDGAYHSLTKDSNKKKTSKKGIDLNIEPLWENYYPSITREVVVAIIDTGVDIDHEDLINHIWNNPNEIPGDGIDNDGNGYIDDINGWDFYNNDATLYSAIYDKKSHTYSSNPNDNDDHGTHCAGIIAAEANNKLGIAGVAANTNVKLMPLKIEGGKKGKGSVAKAIKAIKYAQTMGAKVCNISWGTSTYSKAMELTIKESSMLFVCAAGNTGTNNDVKPVYPASYDLDNIISVTFITPNGRLTTQSNYGVKSVDIAAPGYDIFSTTVGSTYYSMSGSSMAVPHISGLAAMIYAFDDHLYASNVKEVLLQGYRPIEGLTDKMRYPGIPNAENILFSLNSTKCDTTAPYLSIKTDYSGSSFALQINSGDSNGSGVRTIKYLYGEHDLDEFNDGTSGISVTSNVIKLNKKGTYTFYISDYANNSVVQYCEVKEDTSPPVIAASYTISNDYKRFTINVFATDPQSGIKKVKYLKGKCKISDFMAVGSGTELHEQNGVYAFKVPSTGYYTIYAIDNRGNKAVHTVHVAIRKATNIVVVPEKYTLRKHNQYSIRALLYPANSTDVITYQSSAPSIVHVSSNGIATALKSGTATITLKTSSGKKATIVITVP